MSDTTYVPSSVQEPTRLWVVYIRTHHPDPVEWDSSSKIATFETEREADEELRRLANTHNTEWEALSTPLLPAHLLCTWRDPTMGLKHTQELFYQEEVDMRMHTIPKNTVEITY